MKLAVTFCALATLASGACYRGAGQSLGAQVAPQARAGAAVRDPLAFLPADAEIVIDADIARVKRSALWRHVEPIVYGHAGEELAGFREQCGFDPLAQLQRVTFAMRGLESPRASGVFVMRGIDRDATMACLRKSLPSQRNIKVYNDQLAYVEPTDGEDPVSFGFADATTLVVLAGPDASPTALAQVLDGGAPLRASPTFVALFDQIEQDREIWFVMNTRNSFARLEVLGIQTRALTGAISVRHGVHATLRMRVATPDQARQVAIALAAAFAEGSLADNLRVTTDMSEIVGRFAMTDAQVASITAIR